MNVAIYGLGLMGGSFGRAVIGKAGDTVFAYDISEKAMGVGKLLNAYTQELTDKNIGKVDLAVFSLYPDALEQALDENVKKFKKGTVVIDFCGNKRRVVEQMQKLAKDYPDIKFVSVHPMAGREFSGVRHSTVNLFDNASAILVNVNADLQTLTDLKHYFLKIGFSRVVLTDAANHDRIIAYTSQLAHLVSSSYIKSPTAEEYLGFSAGSFRDMTRVARLSADMWSQLMTDNADNLVRELDEIIKHLTEYKNALQNKDKQGLYDLLADGNEKKLASEKMKRDEK